MLSKEFAKTLRATCDHDIRTAFWGEMLLDLRGTEPAHRMVDQRHAKDEPSRMIVDEIRELLGQVE